jgi:hypothetical protein
VAEQASQEAVSVTLSICDRPTASCCCTERLVLRVLVGVLFTVVHLLLERLRLLLVRKRESGQTFFELEGVEEDAILVVREGVVYLLVPDDATVGRLHNVSMPYVTSLRTLTDMSTSLIQKVLPTRSFASTAAPCRPVYVQLCLSG